jgi:hypothetical protein
MTWNLAEAEHRLGEVLSLADVEAQMIVRRDREYVLLSADEYRELKGERPLTEFLTGGGPRSDDVASMSRPVLPMRDSEL